VALLSQSSKMIVCDTSFELDSFNSSYLWIIGAWSAPSAIGIAGVGLGGQAGAEMTDFLIVLNSRSVGTCFIYGHLGISLT
jgi:hypothetical protein